MRNEGRESPAASRVTGLLRQILEDVLSRRQAEPVWFAHIRSGQFLWTVPQHLGSPDAEGELSRLAYRLALTLFEVLDAATSRALQGKDFLSVEWRLTSSTELGDPRRVAVNPESVRANRSDQSGSDAATYCPTDQAGEAPQTLEPALSGTHAAPDLELVKQLIEALSEDDRRELLSMEALRLPALPSDGHLTSGQPLETVAETRAARDVDPKERAGEDPLAALRVLAARAFKHEISARHAQRGLQKLLTAAAGATFAAPGLQREFKDLLNNLMDHLELDLRGPDGQPVRLGFDRSRNLFRMHERERLQPSELVQVSSCTYRASKS